MEKRIFDKFKERLSSSTTSVRVIEIPNTVWTLKDFEFTDDDVSGTDKKDKFVVLNYRNIVSMVPISGTFGQW